MLHFFCIYYYSAAIYIYAFSRCFIQSDLQYIEAIHFFSMCVPWDWTHNLLRLTQCSTTEPQEHYIKYKY